ncbi:MAG: hypothetical protein KAJ73_00535 [Zetaproteobacteria bacterium]|nr:hypothetical protein [Zetaproteobacteria bacterium]
MKDGLLVEPARREVVCDARDNPFNANVFSMSEAAAALGRTLVTLNRYLSEDMLPYPIIYTTSHGYKQFSRGELNLIAKCLAKHAEEFDYFHKSHFSTIERIHSVIERYRTVNNLK